MKKVDNLHASSRYVVAGCNGRFGGVISKKLKRSGSTVIGIDMQEAPDVSVPWDDYIRGSLSEPDERLLAAIRSVDYTVLCTPEPVVLQAIPRILPHVAPTACVADIASVKTRIAGVVGESSGTCGYLSFHPMFAPTDDFRERRIITIPLRMTPATSSLTQTIESWGATVVPMRSAEEHDRLMATVQVVPHAALIALGAALLAIGRSADELLAVATPVHTQLLSTLTRILRGGADTYWSIQMDNPYAAEARRELSRAIHWLDDCCTATDGAAFDRTLKRLSQFLGSHEEELFRCSQPKEQIALDSVGESRTRESVDATLTLAALVRDEVEVADSQPKLSPGRS